MVPVMAKIEKQTDIDDLVIRARTDSEALGRLYEMYYEPIFRFCMHRLFCRETAEDVTSTVFLAVAAQIRTFAGRTQADFRNWLYAIAVNHTNAYIRKTSRRIRLFASSAASIAAADNDCTSDKNRPDWPTLYSAILKLKPNHQTIVTLRFFENMDFEQIGKIINIKPAAVRVALHRILKELKNRLQTIADRGP